MPFKVDLVRRVIPIKGEFIVLDKWGVSYK